jgi:hypothetical protein
MLYQGNGRLINTPVPHSGGTGFKFRPGALLSWLRYFVIFFAPPPQDYFRIEH